MNWLNVFEKTSEDNALSEAHIAFLRQLGEALLVRYAKGGFGRNMVLKNGYFWNDVIASLGGFKQYVLERIFEGAEILEYEMLVAEFKLSGNAGGVSRWSTLKAWLDSDFELNGRRLTKSISLKDKTFVPNPELARR